MQALSVGIFPYVLKLLQTTATELRQILVFIWTKILALDKVTAMTLKHKQVMPILSGRSMSKSCFTGFPNKEKKKTLLVTSIVVMAFRDRYPCYQGPASTPNLLGRNDWQSGLLLSPRPRVERRTSFTPYRIRPGRMRQQVFECLLYLTVFDMCFPVMPGRSCERWRAPVLYQVPG